MSLSYLCCSECGKYIMKADVGSHAEIVCPKCKSLLEFRAVDTNTLVTKIKERSQKKNKSNSAYTI